MSSRPAWSKISAPADAGIAGNSAASTPLSFPGARDLSMALAEGGGLDPVLAGGRAESLAPVARDVDVDTVAVRRGAHAEPVVQFAAEHEGEPGRAAGRPASGQ